MENQVKLKLFNLDIYRLKGEMKYDTSGWQAAINLETRINDLQFNTTKGSYAKQKLLTADIGVQFVRHSKTLRIPPQPFRFDGQPVQIGGEFNFSQQPALFSLAINASQIPFRLAASLVTPNISSKLDSLDFEKPLDVTADIHGRMKFRDTPYVKVNWTVKDNVMKGRALDAGKREFHRRVLQRSNARHGPQQRQLAPERAWISAMYDSIPVTADTIRVIELAHPVLTGRF